MRPQPAKPILLLSPFFYPEPISTGRYNTHLARALVAAGQAVEVIASHPLYPDWRPARSTAQLPGMRILRGGAWMRYPGGTVGRRLLLEAWYAIQVCARLLPRRRAHAAVVAVFPPVGFMLLAHRLLPRGVRRIGIVHDLQGIMAQSTRSGIRALIAGLMRRVERRVFARCDLLVCLSHSMRDVLVRDYGIAAEKCRVHYPFVTLDEEAGTARLDDTVLPEGYRHVVYAGALGEKQRPRELLAFFLRLCARRADVMCHVFSTGPAFRALAAEAERAGEPRLRCHPLVGEDCLADLYRRSALQVIPQAPGTGAGAFPSKLPNLLALGVPVLAVCDADSELARVLAESGGGTAVPGGDPEALAGAAEALLADATDRAARRKALQAYVATRFGVDPVIAAITGSPD